MKIVRNDIIYIQAKDLKRLNESNDILSRSFLYFVYLKFNNYKDYDDDEFVSFNVNDSCFNDIDWIIDFDEIKDLFEDQIIDICNELIEQRNSIANRYNSYSNKERVKNRYLYNKCKNIDYKISSYKEIIKIMHGKKELQLPDGIYFPKGFIKKNKVKKLFKDIRK